MKHALNQGIVLLQEQQIKCFYRDHHFYCKFCLVFLDKNMIKNICVFMKYSDLSTECFTINSLSLSSKLLYGNTIVNDLWFLHTPFRLRSARLLFNIRVIRFFRSFEAPFERLLLENIIPLDGNSIEVIMREVNLIISKLLEETIPYTFPWINLVLEIHQITLFFIKSYRHSILQRQDVIVFYSLLFPWEIRILIGVWYPW